MKLKKISLLAIYNLNIPFGRFLIGRFDERRRCIGDPFGTNLSLWYKPSKYELIFLICLTIERLGAGIFTTIPTICQLDIANLYNVDVSEVARILSARKFAAIAGSVVAALYFYFQWGTHFLDPMTVCGSMMLIMSVMIACAPLMPTLSLLFWDVLIANILYGFLDLALQSIIIQSWGFKKSMPVVQFYHMLWGLGAIIAPYVTLPFCSIEGEEDIEDICGIEEKNETLAYFRAPTPGHQMVQRVNS